MSPAEMSGWKHRLVTGGGGGGGGGGGRGAVLRVDDDDEGDDNDLVAHADTGLGDRHDGIKTKQSQYNAYRGSQDRAQPC